MQILPLYEEGALYWEKSQPEKAKESFEKALDLSEQFNDQFGIARVNIGFGVSFYVREILRWLDKLLNALFRAHLRFNE